MVMPVMSPSSLEPPSSPNPMSGKISFLGLNFVLFLTEEVVYSHGSLQARELGQTPLNYVSMGN